MHPAAWLLAAGALAVPPPEPADTGNRSLTSSGPIFAQPLPAVPPPPLDPPRDRKAEEQILLLRSTIRSLTEALALANTESEVFKRQVEDLSLRLEALGVPGLEGDLSKTEGRLVAAVRDLRLATQRAESLQSQLIRLSEAVQLMLSTSENVDPQHRAALEAELRKTNELLGAAPAPPGRAVEPSLTDAQVIDVKAELSLLIANIGRKHGVRVGMPFLVFRDGRRIAEARAVDVREAISGAIIQSLDNEKVPVQTGDRLRVDAKR